MTVLLDRHALTSLLASGDMAIGSGERLRPDREAGH